MQEAYHRGVFSWPAAEWVTKEGKISPNHLGVNVIQHDAIEELTNMVGLAQEKKTDETLAIFDLGCAIDRFMLWKECFPDIQPFYAIKVYDDPVLISVLSRLGTGFDCASKNEVDLVLRCGADPSSIIYANTIKFPSHLVFAANNDVTLMTVDNEEELLKIKNHAPNARLVVRMAAMPADNIQWDLCTKFGCSRQQALKLLKLAQQLDLEVVGISFHVGSGCSDASTYISHIRAARELFDDALSEGFHLKLLDIGGGLYGNTGAEEKIQKMCGPINGSLHELFPESCGVKVIAEPGRYFVEAALSLATCIVGKRVSEHDLSKTESTGLVLPNKVHEISNEHVAFEYYLSEGRYGLLNVDLFDEFEYKNYNLRPIKRWSVETPLYYSKLWGPTCDSLDVVMKDCHIPELDIGDWLLFRDVGAYTVTVAGTFNGVPSPKIQRVITQSLWDKLINTISME